MTSQLVFTYSYIVDVEMEEADDVILVIFNKRTEYFCGKNMINTNYYSKQSPLICLKTCLDGLFNVYNNGLLTVLHSIFIIDQVELYLWLFIVAFYPNLSFLMS